MATLIKVKEHTKARLKKFAVRKFGDEVGHDATYDTIISILLKDAESKPAFDLNKVARAIERGVRQ